MSSQRSPAAIVAWVAGLFLVGVGLWAMAGPRSFFDALAAFEPYNRHLIQDIGAFQIGLGAVLLIAVSPFGEDALTVALLGVGVGLTAHTVSHLLGADLGGNPAVDIPFFAFAAALLLVTGYRRYRSG